MRKYEFYFVLLHKNIKKTKPNKNILLSPPGLNSIIIERCQWGIKLGYKRR